MLSHLPSYMYVVTAMNCAVKHVSKKSGGMLTGGKGIMQTLHQRIHVTYQYAVHFTQHLFALDNPLLYNVIQDSAPGQPQGIAPTRAEEDATRLLCFIDSGVVR